MYIVFYIFKSIVVLLIILLLVNYGIKNVNKVSIKKNRTINMIEKYPVSKESYLSIVSVCETYYLMSISPNKIELLKELTLDEIKEIKVKEIKNIEQAQLNQLRQKEILVTQFNKIKSIIFRRSSNGK